jgi:hypothetical protein
MNNMPFKVKATLVAWLGNIERYPCHFCYELGEEIIFDGERVHGRICPDLLPPLAEKAMNMHVAGPRYVDPGHYYPFWYSPPSVTDENKSVYDGTKFGFKNVLKTIEEPPYHVRQLQDPKSFNWPPHPERTVAKDISVLCPDQRSSGLFRLEVIDLSDTGMDAPYFRRQMTIMDRAAKKGGSVPIHEIGNMYDNFELMEIYPPLVREMIEPLIEELVLLEMATVKDGVLTVTEKGEERVARFRAEAAPEVVKALKL